MSIDKTIWKRGVCGLIAGIIGGFVYAFALSEVEMLREIGWIVGSQTPLAGFLVSIVFSAVIGAGYGIVFGGIAETYGSGLLWGITYGFLWWLAGPLTLMPLLQGYGVLWTAEVARLKYPMLFGHLVGYGAVLGLGYVVLSSVIFERVKKVAIRQGVLNFLRAGIIGGIAGLVGGWIFGIWMGRMGMFPVLAGFLQSDTPMMGRMLHYAFSLAIGASFGVLFQKDIHGTGSSITWGMTYGFIWWILGPLTLMPLWMGKGVQWSLDAGMSAYPSLIGHVVYGILLGFVYSFVERIWRILFTESDPLHREPEGPGIRNLRTVGRGIVASIAGGLLFTIIMVQMDVLPAVASLVGLSSPRAGFIVHMVISAVIGASYGILFRRETYTYGAGLSWGLIYGVVWWFLGPLTLMPVFLGGGVQWKLASALAAYPSLIGHLAYGAGTALVFHWLTLRDDLEVETLGWRKQVKKRRLPGTPAPALWVFVLFMTTSLLLLFSS
jgi:uncharacterized membrane protein YagU involved in acid resistance